jgi:hypothetical protein
MQRIFSSFIHAQERASRLTPNYPQIFSLFFRHYRYQAARVAEESFRAHSRRRSNGQTRTTAAAQHRTGGRRRGAAFSSRYRGQCVQPPHVAEPARRAGAATPPLLVQRESCERDATARPRGTWPRLRVRLVAAAACAATARAPGRRDAGGGEEHEPRRRGPRHVHGSRADTAGLPGLRFPSALWVAAGHHGSGVFPHDPRGHATLILYDGGLQRIGQLPTQLRGEP